MRSLRSPYYLALLATVTVAMPLLAKPTPSSPQEPVPPVVPVTKQAVSDPVFVSLERTFPSEVTLSDAEKALLAIWHPVEETDTTRPVAIQSSDTTQVSVTAEQDTRSGVLYLALHNEATEKRTIKVSLDLQPGLWRFDAALATSPDDDPRRWRMESVLLTNTNSTVKTITIPGGSTLALRVTETVSAARNALQAARVCEREGGTTYAGASVAGNLNRINALIESIPGLLAKGKRDKAATQAHNALLYTAQAMAMTENGRDATINDSDPVWETLTESLSEISLAALKGTPSSRRVSLTNSAEGIEVAFINGSSHSLPLVALGLTGKQEGQKVFRNIPAGGRVAARFPVGADTILPNGLVQIHLGGSSLRFAGVAAVPATPMLQ